MRLSLCFTGWTWHFVCMCFCFYIERDFLLVVFVILGMFLVSKCRLCHAGDGCVCCWCSRTPLRDHWSGGSHCRAWWAISLSLLWFGLVPEQFFHAKVPSTGTGCHLPLDMQSSHRIIIIKKISRAPHLGWAQSAWLHSCSKTMMTVTKKAC